MHVQCKPYRSRICEVSLSRSLLTLKSLYRLLLCPLAGALRTAHNFTVDCHSAHKGLGAGILLLVLTIISLVLFFVLHNEEEYMNLAVYEVSLCEMSIYLLCILSVLACMLKIRRLPAGRSLKRGIFYSTKHACLESLCGSERMIVYCEA